MLDVFEKNLIVLRRKQVEARTGLSRSSIYGKLKANPNRPREFDPTFPRPIPIGGRAVGWLASEIESWLLAQAAKREG